MHQQIPTASRAEAPTLFAFRAALVFCAPMMVNGIGLPYFPVFLAYLKMTDSEIGIILAMPYIMRIFGTSLGTFLADRGRDRADVLLWSACVSLTTALTLYFTQSFWAVLIVYSLQGIFYAPYAPIAEAIIVTGVRRWGFDYGFLRLWGSVAFIASNMLGGWLFGLFGGAMVLPSMACFFTLTLVMALFAPRLGRSRPMSIPLSDRVPLKSSPFFRRDFMCLILGAALVQGSHGLLYSFASIYWADIGFSGVEISHFWTAGVVAEIMVFFFASRFLSSFSLWSLIIVSAIAATARWCLFQLDMGFWGHLSLQCAHALTFACCHIGIQRFLLSRIDELYEATGQGYYTSFTSLFMAITTLLSGYLFQHFDVASFYLMAVVSGSGLVLIVIAYFLQPQSSRSGGKTSEPS